MESFFNNMYSSLIKTDPNTNPNNRKQTDMAVEQTDMAVEHHGRSVPSQTYMVAEHSEPEPFFSNGGLSWSSITEYPKPNNKKPIPRPRPKNVATFMAAEHHGATIEVPKIAMTRMAAKNHGLIVDYESIKIDSPLHLDTELLYQNKRK